MMRNPKSETTSKPYHPVTRWLHAGLVLGVIFQLICAVLMAHPKHADDHIITMTAMAMSGAVIWSIWAGSSNPVSELAEVWMGVHATVAILLFFYLAGHVSMALLHMRSGDPVFKRIRP